MVATGWAGRALAASCRAVPRSAHGRQAGSMSSLLAQTISCTTAGTKAAGAVGRASVACCHQILVLYPGDQTALTSSRAVWIRRCGIYGGMVPTGTAGRTSEAFSTRHQRWLDGAPTDSIAS